MYNKVIVIEISSLITVIREDYMKHKNTAKGWREYKVQTLKQQIILS